MSQICHAPSAIIRYRTTQISTKNHGAVPPKVQPPGTAGLGGTAAQGGGDFVDFGSSPFSQLIEGQQGLEGIIGGGGEPLSPFARGTRDTIVGEFDRLAPSDVTGQSQAALGDVLSGGANIGSFVDPRIAESNTQTFRENVDRQRRSQTDQLRARLASRGLVGSGAETTGLQGIERDIAQTFTQAQRGLATDELSRARGSFESAVGLGEAGRQFDIGARGNLLGTAQGAAAQDQASLLAGLQQGTERQGLLSSIATGLLSESQDAAEFAAQFGLSREQLLEQLQRMDVQQLNTFAQNFLGAAGTAQRGAVGQPR